MTTTKTKKLSKARWLLLDTIAAEGGWTHTDAAAFYALWQPAPEVTEVPGMSLRRIRSAKRGAIMKTLRALAEEGLVVRFSHVNRRVGDGTPIALSSGSGIALTETGYAALGQIGPVTKIITLQLYRHGEPEPGNVQRLRLDDVADERVIGKWFHGDEAREVAWKIDRSTPAGEEAVALIQKRIVELEAQKAEAAAKLQAEIDAVWDEAKAYNDTLPRGTLATEPNKSWAPEVIADSSGQWCGNALRFATKEEAEANVWDLSMRWMLVRDTRVVESTDPVNYQWDVERGLVSVKKEG